ncbi:MAG: hypothetical protein PHO66_08860, partial [Eubacteriales bacterium]|nr:hypothetical protein [Eubacteriales bacterium]
TDLPVRAPFSAGIAQRDERFLQRLDISADFYLSKSSGWATASPHLLSCHLVFMGVSLYDSKSHIPAFLYGNVWAYIV